MFDKLQQFISDDSPLFYKVEYLDTTLKSLLDLKAIDLQECIVEMENNLLNIDASARTAYVNRFLKIIFSKKKYLIDSYLMLDGDEIFKNLKSHYEKELEQHNIKDDEDTCYHAILLDCIKLDSQMFRYIVALLYEISSLINDLKIKYDSNTYDIDKIINKRLSNTFNTPKLKANKEKFKSIMTLTQVATMFRFFKEKRIIRKDINDTNLAILLTHLTGGAAQSFREYLGGEYKTNLHMALTSKKQADELQSIFQSIIDEIEMQKKDILK